MAPHSTRFTNITLNSGQLLLSAQPLADQSIAKLGLDGLAQWDPIPPMHLRRLLAVWRAALATSGI
jgi:hypothetical protein